MRRQQEIIDVIIRQSYGMEWQSFFCSRSLGVALIHCDDRSGEFTVLMAYKLFARTSSTNELRILLNLLIAVLVFTLHSIRHHAREHSNPRHALRPLAKESQDEHYIILMPVNFNILNHPIKVRLSIFVIKVCLSKDNTDCCAQLRIPYLPKRMLDGDGYRYTPYSSYLHDRVAWKGTLYPHESDDELRRSCLPLMSRTRFGETRVSGTWRDGAVLVLPADTLQCGEREGDYGQVRRESWVKADWQEDPVGLPV